MLDVDYLIFGYDMDDNGNVTIKDLWLKKVWQITRSEEAYKKHYNRSISIPRWHEIAHKYKKK